MATVNAVVFEHHEKQDGTFNVKIRVYHKRERRFLDTEHFVSRKQLDAKYRIKDRYLLKIIEETLDEYRKFISDLGNRLVFFSCDDLRNYLRNQNKDIDFVEFCTSHIKRLREEGREGTARNHRGIRNSLVDYFKRDKVSILEIHSNMLYNYERFLKSDRKMIRVNQWGKEVSTVEKGMKKAGVHNHMRDLRTLFNEARRFYNNEEFGLIRIKHYPFARYKVGSAPLTRKRNNSIMEVLRIRDCEVEPNSRAELARDLYLLSLYLCGMNAVDLYNLTEDNIKDGRINYNRSKTQDQRKDNAFISIKIIEEAKPLLAKYLGKLSTRFSDHNGLSAALSFGMKAVCRLTGLTGVTYYYARHTFATTARNFCGVSPYDIGQALNHIDDGTRITDIYLEKDWKIVDNVQLRVISYIRRMSKKKKDTVCNVL